MALPEVLTIGITEVTSFAAWPVQIRVVLGAAFAGAGFHAVGLIADLMRADG